MVLEAASQAYANKNKRVSLPRNLALVTFGELLILFSTTVYLLNTFPIYRVVFASHEAKLFTENFSKNRNLDD